MKANHQSAARMWPFVIVASAAVWTWFAFSRLSFVPVPWPDGSAFFLPGLDLVAWPPRYRMHSQAAFVPSYDIANFNMMPLLPLFFGIVAKLGVGNLVSPALLIKALSLVVLSVWAALLWFWTRTRGGVLVATTVALAALFDPVNRWGTSVVRSEMWIGLFWLLALMELSRSSGRRRLYVVSGLLALSAYTHFEAIILVPAVVVALLDGEGGFSWRAWIGRCLTVGGWTLLFLLPWCLYILAHPSLFWEQMQVQFGRLGPGRVAFSDAYSLFHGMFLSLGSAAPWPKFFNVGKAVFWALIAGSAILGVAVVRRQQGQRLPVLARVGSAFVAFISAFFLWVDKPEAWFLTLSHLTFWPLLALLITELGIKDVERRIVVGVTALFVVVALVATVLQQQKIDPGYSWSKYREWVDCIEEAAGNYPGQKVWQPGLPDVLVELSQRRPDWDFTRTMDFDDRVGLAWDLTSRLDAIIWSRHGVVKEGEASLYRGEIRPQDREWLSNATEVPFGGWALERLPREQPNRWLMTVCQSGPFWAVVAKKNR